MRINFVRMFVCVLLAMSLLPLIACHAADTLIIDQPTPPGDVAPVNSNPKSGLPATPYRPHEGSFDAPDTGTPDISNEESAEFAQAYKKAGTPKIVVYLNRALSVDVKEWSSNARFSVRYSGSETKSDANGVKHKEARGEAAGAIETKVSDPQGPPTEQKWVWELEDAIMEPLRKGGAILVDRAVIIRSTALKEGATGYENTSGKFLEMAALKDYANILIQVEISRQPDERLGYIFRTKAVDIRSGTILASANSSEWKKTRALKGAYSASSDGYVADSLPDPAVLGKWLSRDIMAALAKSL